ncbi:MAG TPA: transglycosylase domain-containing protein [Candidatus Limnocylindrales bacterium]|nr:transglycosylase domain-containing protein [Candidatus Limnocylindrales bacterium]
MPRRTRQRSQGSRVLAVLLTLTLAAILVVGGAVGVFGVAAIATVGALSTDLPDPATLEQLTFAQPTVVYDRTGKVELARFQKEQRRVVSYSDVPKLVVDATTTAEDRTFWKNGGFDPAAIMSAVAQSASGGNERGASTITQQLVRARLLPDQYVAPGADRYLRKAKELIQSARVTETFPGEQGKQRIVAAYLNQIFYGHDAYGIAAAARIYFGVDDLEKLTPAQAALLAGLPKSPTTLDPYRYAKPDKKGRLVVPSSAAPVVRRDWILTNLSTSRWTRLDALELKKALAEPVILAGEQHVRFKAPHFTWQVRRQLEQILGSADAVDTGGYHVITTLDWEGQQLAEKWMTAAVIAPNLSLKASRQMLADLKIPFRDRAWIAALRGKDLHNAALVALDYKSGDVLTYVGSAGYYRDNMRSRKFEPKYDAAGDGARQPGSAFKPIVYATAFEQHKLTPGSLLLDITTQFGAKWAPRDADQLERGPVLVRKALQFSLNIPAIRALQRVGNEAVADQAAKMGIRFAGGRDAYLQSGLAGAIGTVELRPLDLTAAYGTLANGGQYLPPRMVLEIDGPDGKAVYKAPEREPRAALSPQSAFLVTDILEGNTDPTQNPIWSAKLELLNGPRQSRRPAAVKTGTANDARDLATYGFLPPPATDKQPGLAVGIWMGNSDHSNPRSRKPATSLTAAAPLWHAFVRDYTAKWPVTQFKRPTGVISSVIDAYSGGRPGPWTVDRTREWFLSGTQPGRLGAIDPPGLLYTAACGGWRVDPLKAERGPFRWNADVANWMARARRGPGVKGPLDSSTAYFWGRASWGGTIMGPCVRTRVVRSSVTHRGTLANPRNWRGHGRGHHEAD